MQNFASSTSFQYIFEAINEHNNFKIQTGLIIYL